MKITKLGTRENNPAYMDLTGQNLTFRMGDKAAVFAHLSNWRRLHPTNKLSVLTDPFGHETEWSRQLPNDWVVGGGLADVLVEADFAGEKLSKPEGTSIYTENLFSYWRRLKLIEPLPFKAALPHWDVDFTSRLMSGLKVPDEYVTVHPLFDAHYDCHRNGKPAWWYDIIRELAKAVHVVVIGDFVAMSKFPQLPPGCTAFWKVCSTPMQSLCVIGKSRCHVGGDTGMTLWAGLLGVPVVAAYAYWEKPWKKNADRGIDTKPISTGKPVQHMPLHGSPTQCSSTVLRLLS